MSKHRRLNGPTTITLYAVPPSLNKLMRMHWAAKSRLRSKYGNAVFALLSAKGWRFREKNNIPRASVKIIVYQRTRRLDQDNLIGGMKPLIDGMRDAGVIRNDSPAWIDFPAPVQGVDREYPRVAITVEELP